MRLVEVAQPMDEPIWSQRQVVGLVVSVTSPPTPIGHPLVHLDDFAISEDLIRVVDQELDRREAEFGRLFPAQPCNWYGLWMQKVFAGPRLVLLCELIESVFQTNYPACSEHRSELRKLRNSVKQAADFELSIHFELLPAGYSNSLTWEISGHCRVCKFPKPTGPCPACGDTTASIPKKKCKVLGLRPYLRLVELVGEQRSKELLARYLAKFQSDDAH